MSRAIKPRSRSALQKLKQRYGLHPEDYEQMLEDQGGACFVCLEPFKDTPQVDHCHRTGRVRALLCNNCNSMIGHLERKREPKIVLQRVGEYLDLFAPFALPSLRKPRRK